ncbi:MAG: bifunctional riboflavin kinase/FAD synthetase [Planctomycetes bacterium]|nr:bifunctional riboflavin kinase/FAD synthetase [Planctomycetota bacterium]
MQRFHNFDAPECRGGFVAIGNFDGVHLGHQRMLASLVRHAAQVAVPSVVVTFEPHPVQLLRPEAVPPRLTVLEEKLRLLAAQGVESAIVYETNREFLNLTPREFFERIVRGKLAARGLVEGPNFYFGRDRAGDVGTLRELCDEWGLTLDVVPPVSTGGQLVSSSAVRRAIGAGDVALARRMLGRPYRLAGTVVAGAGRGRSLGYPTANLAEVETMLPADGVYAGVAHLDDAQAPLAERGQTPLRASDTARGQIGEPQRGLTPSRTPAAVNVGPNPTFADERRKVEVHLVDYAGELYGRRVEVDFLARLRDTQTFADADELRRQLERDIVAVRAAAAEGPAME